MKTYFLYCACLALVLSSFSGCEDVDTTILPAETQTGKNTFGCYVDGALFLNPGKSYLNIGASFYRDTSSVHNFYGSIVDIYAKYNDKYIHIGIDTFQLNKKIMITQADYTYFADTIYKTPYDYTYCEYECIGRNIPYVYLTRLDTINGIVSGKFEFELTDAKDSTKIIKFTDGRFDIKIFNF